MVNSDPRFQRAIDLSPGVDLRIQEDGENYILVRAGDPWLDTEAVSAALDALRRIGATESRKHFIASLQAFSAGDEDRLRTALNDARVALEELGHHLVDASKSLEKLQGGPLGKWLKERGVHADVRAIFEYVLSYYAQYQNKASKHGSAWSSTTEVEFIIYLTAVLLHFWARLEEEGAHPITGDS